MPSSFSEYWQGPEARLAAALISGIFIGLAVGRLRDGKKALFGVPSTAHRHKKAPDNVHAELKVVLVVNAGLKMGKGKIAAQCAHAAVGLYQEYHETDAELFEDWDEGSGQKKIALSCSGEEELDSIMEAAEEAGCPYFLVQDAGRTQIAAGSSTVLAVGPATDDDLAFTRHLKLL